MNHKNQAAYLTARGARPFKIDTAPMPVPEANEILIRNRAVAINPVDWAIQALGILIETYPFILGVDVAGEVVAVGSAVKNLKPGDRVAAMTPGTVTDKPSNSGFQLFCATTETLAARIPDHVGFAEAAVLPLGLSTAAAALFQKNCLGLDLAALNSNANGKTVLVWGGSSSVGACGIQLVRAAGYEVVTTSSPRNFDFCRGLGADHVFDHTSSTVVEDLVKYLEGKEFAGVFDAISTADTLAQSAKIASQVNGKKFVATVAPPGRPFPDGLPSDVTLSAGK